ncbi:hypothetical protein J2Z72_000056 [Peptostreptococcus canis]|nr:hypothetical protein [Peptostreptococcus canis]
MVFYCDIMIEMNDLCYEKGRVGLSSSTRELDRRLKVHKIEQFENYL